MSRTTAWRYLQDPDVQTRVATERETIRQTLGVWLDRITMVGDLALERVVDLLSDDDTPAHVVARIAVAVMNERRTLVESVEIDERLARLEARADGRDPDDVDGRRRLQRVVEGAA